MADPLQPAATLDPLDDAGEDRDGDGRGREALLEVLFHSDITRIGATTPRGTFLPGTTVTVGRASPDFIGPEGTTAPLADPCISREQLQVTALQRHAFAVTPAGGARRQVALFALDGSPLPPDTPAPSGTLIVVGDRLVLLLTRRRDRADLDHMGLSGESEPMWALRNKIRTAAAVDSTVLIHGESGVGKELVARSIHQQSERRGEPLISVNCAAIPENLLESELFGHVRGAFTGASSEKRGFFRAAARGTLFLDEIGELPLSMQSKLLRVLQERKVCPVGAVREEPVDARVIAATNRELRRDVGAGRFREDLYYRLTTLTIAVPPLRERREDIPGLFRLFFEQISQRHPELRRFWRAASQHPPPVPVALVLDCLRHHWPGNVRQLRNLVEQTAVANLHGTTFRVPDEVIAELRQPAAAGPTSAPTPAPTPAASEMDRPPALGPQRGGRAEQPDEARLLALLETHDYVQSRVARELGVSHTTVDRWMRQLGLRRPRDLGEEELRQVAREANNDLAAMARHFKVSQRGLKLRLIALGLDAQAQ